MAAAEQERAATEALSTANTTNCAGVAPCCTLRVAQLAPGVVSFAGCSPECLGTLHWVAVSCLLPFSGMLAALPHQDRQKAQERSHGVSFPCTHFFLFPG